MSILSLPQSFPIPFFETGFLTTPGAHCLLGWLSSKSRNLLVPVAFQEITGTWLTILLPEEPASCVLRLGAFHFCNLQCSAHVCMIRERSDLEEPICLPHMRMWLNPKAFSHAQIYLQVLHRENCLLGCQRRSKP